MPNQWTMNSGRTAVCRRLSVRLSAAEAKQFEGKVAAAGVSTAEYVRRKLGLKAEALPATARRRNRRIRPAAGRPGRGIN